MTTIVFLSTPIVVTLQIPSILVNLPTPCRQDLKAREGGGLIYEDLRRLYAHPMLLYKRQTANVYYSLYIYKSNTKVILIALNAGCIPRSFHNRKACVVS